MKPVETIQHENEPKPQGFQYKFSPKEFFYFAFAKKECQKCGGKLEKRKDYVMRKGADLNGKSAPFFVSQANIKCYTYLYTCQQCGFQYTLQELVS